MRPSKKNCGVAAEEGVKSRNLRARVNESPFVGVTPPFVRPHPRGIYRRDCGRYRYPGPRGNADTPLHTYVHMLPNKTGEPGPQPAWTNGFCETNIQKSCVDGVVNRDWLFQAKSFNLTKGFTFDWAYCKHNGWLTPRNKALIRQGFEVVDAAAVDECAAIEADTLRLVGIGLNNVTFRNYGPMNHEEKQKDDAHPGYGMNYTAARLTALWMCAMGGANGKLNGAGCDMAYCAYTYGDLHGDAQLMPGVNPNNTRNGKMCMYEECVGWRPEYGMPGTY